MYRWIMGGQSSEVRIGRPYSIQNIYLRIARYRIALYLDPTRLLHHDICGIYSKFDLWMFSS